MLRGCTEPDLQARSSPCATKCGSPGGTLSLLKLIYDYNMQAQHQEPPIYWGSWALFLLLQLPHVPSWTCLTLKDGVLRPFISCLSFNVEEAPFHCCSWLHLTCGTFLRSSLLPACCDLATFVHLTFDLLRPSSCVHEYSKSNLEPWAMFMCSCR